MPGGAPSSSMPCNATYGIGPNTSKAGRSSRNGPSAASPAPEEPHQHPARPTIFCPTRSDGTKGAGGAVITAAIVVNSSLTSAAHVRVPLKHLAAALEWEPHQSADDRTERMQSELETRHDAEVPAAAAQSPDELRFFGATGSDDIPRRGHHFGSGEVVGREPVPPHQPADPTSQREACDPGMRDQASRARQPVRLGRRVEVGPRRP